VVPPLWRKVGEAFLAPGSIAAEREGPTAQGCSHPTERVLEKRKGIRGKLWMLRYRLETAGGLLVTALGRLGTCL